MLQLLVDSSALYALADANEVNHQRVSHFVRQRSCDFTLIVTDWILDETLTLIKSRFGWHVAVQVGERIRHSTFCQFVHLTPQDEQLTWEVFQQYRDKAWSYTDCSCLAIMQRLKISEALSLDRHFRQMGITVWP